MSHWLHKKWSFPLRISSINVTKSAGDFRAVNTLRYFNFDPSFKLRWCRALDLFVSQISVTTGGFELQISCIRSSYLTHYVPRLPDIYDSLPSSHRSFFIISLFSCYLFKCILPPLVLSSVTISFTTYLPNHKSIDQKIRLLNVSSKLLTTDVIAASKTWLFFKILWLKNSLRFCVIPSK